MSYVSCVVYSPPQVKFPFATKYLTIPRSLRLSTFHLPSGNHRSTVLVHESLIVKFVTFSFISHILVKSWFFFHLTYFAYYDIFKLYPCCHKLRDNGRPVEIMRNGWIWDVAVNRVNRIFWWCGFGDDGRGGIYYY